MSKPFQPILYPLPTLTFAASGRVQLDLSGIPPIMGNGRFAHLMGIDFMIPYTPTLNSGGIIPEEAMTLVNNITIKNQVRTLWDGGFEALRLFEALERSSIAPEADSAATTEAVNYKRSLNMGPPLMAGFPSDCLEPVGVFKGVQCDCLFGALADADAQLTALTSVIRPYARIALLDEIRIPPFVERKIVTVNPDVGFGGEAMHLFLGLAKSATFPVIAAGDYTAAQVLGLGYETQSIPLPDLERAYHEDMGAGPVSLVHGEVLTATDDNPKYVSGTAVAAATSAVSPVLWTPRDGRISKVWARSTAQNQLRVKWTGTGTSFIGLNTRIVPRSAADTEKYKQLVEVSIQMRLDTPVPKTLSKEPYNGPLSAYMPLVARPVR